MAKANPPRLVPAISILVASLAGVSAVWAAPGDIYNLGTLGGASSEGWAINEAGQVAGWSFTTGGLDHPFRYSGTPGSGGTMADLGTLGGTNNSIGRALNNGGQVAGYARITGKAADHVFRYSGTPGSGGAMADLGTLGGANSYGKGINDAGQVAGTSYTTGSTAYHAFRYSGTPGSGGAMADLGTLGGTLSEGTAINDAGQVAGYSNTTGDAAAHAFRYSGTPGSGGAMADLGTLGGTDSYGYAINNAGQVAGNSYTTGNTTLHAFRYSGTPGLGGAMVDLGTLGGANSAGYGMNDAGFVVGVADRSAGNGGGSWPALWQTDAVNTAVDLDAWLDAINPTAGASWTLTEARDISNNGLITGFGTYNDGAGGLTDGTRAFILDGSSLVPEPTGLSLVAAGALGLLWSRRRGAGTGRGRIFASANSFRNHG